MDENCLYTPRLALEPMTDEALCALVMQEGDPHMKAAYGEMLEGCRTGPEGRLWYTCWAVKSRADGDTLGDFCFKGPPKDGRVEIGYGLYSEKAGGKGYMTEAVAAACAWAFQNGAGLVTAEAEAENGPSLRLLKGLGFLPDGMGEEGPRFVLDARTLAGLDNTNLAPGQVISPMEAAGRVAARPPRWLHEYLCALPGAEVGYKIEWGWYRYLVGGKQFAAVTFPGEKSAVYGGRLLANLKCDPLEGDGLRQEYPGKILPAFYMDKVRWIAVFLDEDLPQSLVFDLCRKSYNAVMAGLPKKVQREIKGEA